MNLTKSMIGFGALVALSFGSAMACFGQVEQVPAPSAPAAPSVNAPKAATTFPPANLKNFTADAPTKNDVDAFLKAMWGYDPNRIWQVMGIQKTQAAGVAKVSVLVGDKSQPGKTALSVFFTTPDGQHAIADNVIDFGPKPFAANRAVLQAQAAGAARGAAGKELLIVEFGDLQCPVCRESQTKVESLVQDFPQARFLFENFPLTEVHPFAMRAAEEGECVRKMKGDAAFFTFAQAVYDTQAGLTEQTGSSTLGAAVTKAGADPVAVGKCAVEPATHEAIVAQMKLGSSLGVESTPTLAVNGHLLPLGSLPYESLKRIVAFQATQDGMTVTVQPTLSTLGR